MLRAWSARASAFFTLGVVFVVIGWAVLYAGSEGGAYRPKSDGEVLLRRAPRSAAEQAALGARQAAPHDLSSTLALARAQIEAARESGDLYPLGRAQALLAPFAHPPRAEVLVLQATIAQARHDFASALQALERALRLAPRDAQAHLTRAALLTVLGRYQEARASCASLVPLVSRVVSTLCRANIDALTGARDEALTAIERSAREARSVGERAWALSLLCEHAFWGAQLGRARVACDQALRLDPRDRYTRALFADVLLEAGEPARALALTRARDDDALLLRQALAALALGRAEAPGLVARLEQSFRRARARGDQVHQREEARLLLALGKEPARALGLARAGFAAQREPWDLRLFLSAAQAARAADAALSVRSFMRDQHIAAELVDVPVARIGSAS